MVDFTRDVHCLLGLPCDAVGMEQAARRLERAHREGEHCFLSTPNLNYLVMSQDDAGFRDSVGRSDVSVADGMPLVWLARLMGIPIRERVSGSGLFDWLRTHSHEAWRVFFFGGPEGVGERASAALAQGSLAMQGCGHVYPGFGSVEQMSRPDWIEAIRTAQANFVVVSLGSVKGQAWITRNLGQVGPAVVAHLGAVVNFAAGTVRRAPRWMQLSGLEWLWRVKEEPRLWRRYLGDAIGLARLTFTRALPLALLRRLQAPTPEQLAAARVEMEPARELGFARLSGAWQQSNLAPVRRAFQTLISHAGDVTLDLSGTTHVDSAFAGLLVLLDTALRDRGDRLRLIAATPRVQRLLRLYGALPTGHAQ